MSRAPMLFLLLILTLSILPITLPIYAASPIHINQLHIIITESNITASTYLVKGSGTIDDPYILKFGTLDLSGGYILLANFTNKYVRIENSTITNGGAGNWGTKDANIVLYNITNSNFTIYNTTLSQGDNFNIRFEDIIDGNVTLDNCTISNAQYYGIYLTGNTNTTLYVIKTEIYGVNDGEWWNAGIITEGLSTSYKPKIIVEESNLHDIPVLIRINSNPGAEIYVYDSHLHNASSSTNSIDTYLIRIDSGDAYVYIENSILGDVESSGSYWYEASLIRISSSASGEIHLKNVDIKGVARWTARGIGVLGTASLIEMNNVSVVNNGDKIGTLLWVSGGEIDRAIMKNVEIGLGSIDWDVVNPENGKLYNLIISNVTVYSGWKLVFVKGSSELKNATIEYVEDYEQGSQREAFIYIDGAAVADNITLRNVTVTGENQLIYIISGATTSNIYVYNTTVDNLASSGILVESGVTLDTLIVIHSNFSRCTNYGVEFHSGSNIEVKNNTFWHNGYSPQAYSDTSGVVAMYNLYTDHISTDNNNDGIADTPYNWAGSGGIVDNYPIYYPVGIAYIILNDTTLADNRYGVVISGTGSSSDPYIVELRCSSVGSGFQYAVLIDNVSKYINITGIVGGAPSEADLYIGSNITGHITLLDLKVSGSGKHGIYIEGLTGGITFYRNITLEGTFGGWAIALIDDSQIVLYDITINMGDTGWDGIWIENSDHITVHQVSVTDPQYKGITIKNSDSITIQDSTFTGAGDHTIYLTDTVSNVQILSVQIYGGRRGINLEGTISNLTIKDTTIMGPFEWGDAIVGESISFNRITIENVVIRKAAWKGIYIGGSGSDLVIKNVDIDGESSYDQHPPIYIVGSSSLSITDVVIDNCNIRNANIQSWAAAIRLEEVKNVNITNTIITNNAYRGIAILRGDTVRIENCTITNNGYHGIIVFGLTNSNIIKNDISGNGGKGIAIYWRDYGGGSYVYSDNIIIKNNTIANNGLNGIYISGNSSNILIKYNVFAHNGYSGADPTTQVALFVDNGCTGIVITWNDFKFNKHSPQAKAPDTVTFDYNAWSDYTLLGGHDSDGDGIGDTPYTIPGPTDPTDPNPRMYYLDGSPLLPTPELPILPLLLVATLLILIIIKKRG